MKCTIYFCLVLGATLASGCAGPLDKRWDDPLYRSIQDQYTDHDRQNAGIQNSDSSAPLFSMSTLDSLSVEDAIRLAIDHHPDLRAAGYRVDAASGRVLQSGLYPNPSFNFGAEALGASDGSGGETVYTIEQEIVLGGKLKRARELARSGQLLARNEFIAEEFAVATRVSQAYFAAIAAQERLANREELVVLASQLLEAATSKVEAGSATVPDQLRAEVAYEQSTMELETARFEAQATRQTLASTIGLDESLELPFASPLNRLPHMPPHEKILSATLESNTRVLLARLATTQARQAHMLAKARGVPNLVASVGPRYSDIDGETTLDVGLGMQIPLFDRNQGEIQATLAERLSASAQLEAVQLELQAEVSQAWAMYESAYAAANRYQNRLLPMAEQTLDLTRQAYNSGKADYLRLLDAQQIMVESKIAYTNTLEQLHDAAAMLNELSQTNTPWRSPRIEDQPQVEVNQE